MKRRGFIGLGALAIATTVLSGCGGGGGGKDTSTSQTTGTAPSTTTRAQVQNLHSQLFRNLSSIGYQPISVAYFVNGTSLGGVAGGTTGSGTTGGTGSAPTATQARPLVGAFLKNVANQRPTGRKQAIETATRIAKYGITRQEEPPLPPGGDTPIVAHPTEYSYFDYYLGLYVHVKDNATKSVYALFEDEAQTKPAGNITTEQPADWNTYPLVFKSSYTFEKGYLAGSHGSSSSTTTKEGVYTSDYTNVYADGSKDSGKSTFTPTGDSSWTSRADFKDGSYTSSRGTFRADGSGGVHMEGSDGYVADYTFNKDGSGRGTVSGKQPGLPATITWDAYGNTTIQFADGSILRFSGWSDGSGTTGSGTTGTTTGGDTTGVLPVEPATIVGGTTGGTRNTPSTSPHL